MQWLFWFLVVKRSQLLCGDRLIILYLFYCNNIFLKLVLDLRAYFEHDHSWDKSLMMQK